MIYKREESFRYQFSQPLTCTFSIVEIESESVSTGVARGELLDLSPKGLRLGSSLNIPQGSKSVTLKVTFKMNEETIIADSVIVWKKKSIHLGYQYGLEFINTSDLPELITKQLKMFAKQNTQITT